MQATTGFSMKKLKSVDLEAAKELELPAPWPQLEKDGFHEDLIIRAKAYYAWCKREGHLDQAEDLLRIIGEGFTKTYDASTLIILDNDPFAETKRNVLKAMQALADKYGDRVSNVVWYSLSYIATRDEPLTDRSILKEASQLPYHYSVVDGILHAVGKVYTFMLDIHTSTCKHSGHILIHNCDCGCSLINMQEQAQGSVNMPLALEKITEATYSLLSHILSESVLIRVNQLPFALSVSPEAAEILAMEI